MSHLTSRLRGILFTAVLVLGLLACTSVLPNQVSFPTEDPHLDIPRVSLAEARAAFDTGAAIFIDVRGAQSYTASHIPGALSIPLDVLGTRLDEFDIGQWIITYCT